MCKLDSLKPNDLVVRYGKVLKVIKVTKTSIELQPYYNLNKNNQITYTAQLQQTNQEYIRPLTDKKEAASLLKQLAKSSSSNKAYLKNQANPKTNSLKDSLLVIKALTVEKQKNEGNLPSGKQNIYKLAMLQASEEIGAIKTIQPIKAEKLILSSIGL